MRLFGILNIDPPNRAPFGTPAELTTDEARANLITSHVTGKPDMHMPVIDLDFPAKLVPSTTEGHFHLYLDKEISWEKYEGLLRALFQAGLIEDGYYRSAMIFKGTYARKPGTVKPADYYDHVQPTQEYAAQDTGRLSTRPPSEQFMPSRLTSPPPSCTLIPQSDN